MANIELEQGMKNHPGFMPFTHCNTKTHVDEPENKTEKKASESDTDN